ncbi:MAG: hypothetical protein LH610_00605 [Sphingomonas bacterium]|nr:hypothetical protein [Sphingomonas bacterium]
MKKLYIVQSNVANVRNVRGNERDLRLGCDTRSAGGHSRGAMRSWSINDLKEPVLSLVQRPPPSIRGDGQSRAVEILHWKLFICACGEGAQCLFWVESGHKFRHHLLFGRQE